VGRIDGFAVGRMRGYNPARNQIVMMLALLAASL
jgi:hypothetical protein